MTVVPTINLITLGGMREARFRDYIQKNVNNPAPSIRVVDMFDGRRIGREKIPLSAYQIAIANSEPTDGEIGCLLAHMAVWHRLIDEVRDDKTWWIVCEDDMRPCAHMVRLMNEAASFATTQDVDIVFLNHEQSIFPECAKKVCKQLSTGESVFHPPPLFGGGAYMLTRKAACAFLKNMTMVGGCPYVYIGLDEVTWATYYDDTPGEYEANIHHTYGEGPDKFLLYDNLISLLNNSNRARIRALAFSEPFPFDDHDEPSLTSHPSWTIVDHANAKC